MQKWYNGLSKGQKLTILIPASVLAFVIGANIGMVCGGDVGGAVIGCMVVIAPFIFFELGSKK